jgi:lipid-A-disaccharide synthase-like uncharacterized protein
MYGQAMSTCRMHSIYDFLGIVGAILVLFGFWRISIGQWTGKNFWYEMDNLLGSVLILIYQIHYKVYISVIVNVIWAIVAFRGVISYRERKPK